jgi:hypothetical protein
VPLRRFGEFTLNALGEEYQWRSADILHSVLRNGFAGDRVLAFDVKGENVGGTGALGVAAQDWGPDIGARRLAARRTDAWGVDGVVSEVVKPVAGRAAMVARTKLRVNEAGAAAGAGPSVRAIG